jgi:hypothetical protein
MKDSQPTPIGVGLVVAFEPQILSVDIQIKAF